MKPDIFKLVDILAVAAVALAWSHPLWAQSVEADLAECKQQSQGVKVKSPGEVMQAIADATSKCLAQKERARQLRSIQAHKHAQATCGESVSARMKAEKLPETVRLDLMTACKSHRQIQ